MCTCSGCRSGTGCILSRTGRFVSQPPEEVKPATDAEIEDWRPVAMALLRTGRHEERYVGSLIARVEKEQARADDLGRLLANTRAKVSELRGEIAGWRERAERAEAFCEAAAAHMLRPGEAFINHRDMELLRAWKAARSAQ